MIGGVHGVDQRGLGVQARVGGEQAGRVGEQHQVLRAEKVGDQGGEAVVVAEADLVVRGGVVLVDDGHHVELEQSGQRGPCVQVLVARSEVQRGQQHLAGDQAVSGQGPFVGGHQPALSDRSDRLEGDRIAGSHLSPEVQCGQPGRDGPGGHHDHGGARGAGGGDLGAESRDRILVDAAIGSGDRGRTDLGDHDRALPGAGVHPSAT